MASELIVAIDEQNFAQEVNQSATPVLIDFWAGWCGPCVRAEPLLDALAEEYKGRLKIGKIDVEQNESLRVKFNVMGIPAFFTIKNGEVIDRLEGARKEKLKEMIERVLA